MILSPTISEIYHFMNLLVAISFFVLTVYIFLIFSYLTRNISINKYILTLAMGLMIIFYTSNNYIKMKKNSIKQILRKIFFKVLQTREYKPIKDTKNIDTA